MAVHSLAGGCFLPIFEKLQRGGFALQDAHSCVSIAHRAFRMPSVC